MATTRITHRPLKKRGPKPKGEPWGAVTFSARQPLIRQLKAVAEHNDCTVSAWVRWAVRMVLARQWTIPEQAKDDGDVRSK